MPNILVLLNTCRERTNLQKQSLFPFLNLWIIPKLLSHLRLSPLFTRRNSCWRRWQCSLSYSSELYFPCRWYLGMGNRSLERSSCWRGTRMIRGGTFALLLGCVALHCFVRGRKNWKQIITDYFFFSFQLKLSYTGFDIRHESIIPWMRCQKRLPKSFLPFHKELWLRAVVVEFVKDFFLVWRRLQESGFFKKQNQVLDPFSHYQSFRITKNSLHYVFRLFFSSFGFAVQWNKLSHSCKLSCTVLPCFCALQALFSCQPVSSFPGPFSLEAINLNLE